MEVTATTGTHRLVSSCPKQAECFTSTTSRGNAFRLGPVRPSLSWGSSSLQASPVVHAMDSPSLNASWQYLRGMTSTGPLKWDSWTRHCKGIWGTWQDGTNPVLAVLLVGSLTPRLYGVVPFQIRSGGDESPVVQYADGGVAEQIKIKLLLNPNGDGESDSKELILTKAFQNGVLALPGTSSLPNGQKSACVRLMFSLLPPEEMAHEALKRFEDQREETRVGMGYVKHEY